MHLLIFGHESGLRFRHWNILWSSYLWLSLGLFRRCLTVKLLGKHGLDLLILDHGWVLIVLNLWSLAGVPRRLLSYVGDLWKLDA